MKKLIIAAFAAGIMVTTVNAQTAPATTKAQTTTTQTKAADKKVEKKEIVHATPAKKAKHVHKVHASAQPAVK